MPFMYGCTTCGRIGYGNVECPFCETERLALEKRLAKRDAEELAKALDEHIVAEQYREFPSAPYTIPKGKCQHCGTRTDMWRDECRKCEKLREASEIESMMSEREAEQGYERWLEDRFYDEEASEDARRAEAEHFDYFYPHGWR